MPSLVGWLALLGSWLAADDANEAIRVLAERTQKLAAFSATYHERGFDGQEQEIRLYYKAPECARFDTEQTGESSFVWLHGSLLSLRGVDRRGRYAAEYDLADGGTDGERFEAMLDREFARPAAPVVTPKDGPCFRIDISPPAPGDVDGPIVVGTGWSEPKLHLLAWLDGGTPASPWRADGDEFVRQAGKSGIVRVSAKTGMLVRLTSSSDVEVRLVRSSEEVTEEALTVPPRAANEEDRSSAMAWEFLNGRLRHHRRDAYEAALRAASDASKEVAKYDARLIRVFSFIHRPICERMDVDFTAAMAKPLQQFAEWCRRQRLEAGDSAEKQAAADAAIAKWKASYEKSIEDWQNHFESAFESPLDDDDASMQDAAAPKRVDAMRTLDRAAFHALFQAMVRSPAMTRLEKAQQVTGGNH